MKNKVIEVFISDDMSIKELLNKFSFSDKKHMKVLLDDKTILNINIKKGISKKYKLERTSFDSSKNNKKWDTWYNLAKVYYDHYGNLEIPVKFKTKNGIDYDEDGVSLGKWIQSQRFNQDALLPERHRKLELIGFRFEKMKPNERRRGEKLWNVRYNLAKSYYDHYGNLEIPVKFKTKNGVDYDEDGVNLGKWIQTQRINQGSLTSERRKKLELIEFRFEKMKPNERGRDDKSWNVWYNLAKSYYEYYGNLEVSAKFKTKNGIDYDEDGVNLGKWVQTQRINQGSLTSERRKKLELIEFRFEVMRPGEWKRDDTAWNSWYNLAKSYYEYYGNLKISPNFKTKNGIDYDEDGVNLGFWVNNQRKRQLYLTSERLEKLNLIGMIWNVRKNKMEIVDLLNSYNIDIQNNKNLLKKSYKEIYGKIMFLLDNNIPIVTNGEVCDIFFMSDVNMQVKYGVSLADLIRGKGKAR